MSNAVVERIKNMSVAWFSFNLATSAIILSSFILGNVEHMGLLLALAKTLAIINSAVFVFIAVLYSIRVIIGWQSFKALLRNPVQGPFLTVISIATMVLSLDWSLVLHNIIVATALFYAGLILHTILFLAVMYYLERHQGIEIHYMNPGWYMPAVGNVLAPFVGMVLVPKGIPVPRSLLGIYLGTGTIMWLALFAIWLYRVIFYSPQPARLMATMWINLAPPAVIPLSYEALLGFTPRVYRELFKEAIKSPVSPLAVKLLIDIYDLFYYTFWGTAGLLFALVMMLTIGYFARKEIEFAESWWAFTFPLAAYVISTVHLYLHHPSEHWLLYYAWFLYILTWISYIVTTSLSIYYGYEEVVKKVPEKKLPPAARPLPVDGTTIEDSNKRDEYE